MTSNDRRNGDPVFAAIAGLRPYDVGSRRASRLRGRCHAALHAQEDRRERDVSVWKRVVGPALAGVWCAVYLVEVIRRAAMILGF